MKALLKLVAVSQVFSATCFAGGLDFSAPPTTEELFRARVFEEPLVPVGGEPSVVENADLAAALRGYAHRNGPDDFSSLTAFLDQHPSSVWRASLLTGLGLEYYNTAHYSLALEAWKKAWAAGQNARTARGKALADRAGGELAYMYGRLGRMSELEPFLKSVEGRPFIGPGKQRIIGAREGLWMMKNQPEIAFFCGPQALGCIKAETDPSHSEMDIIRKAASTTNGCSLPQVAELSHDLDLNYQMAFREKSGEFIVPSVVHWKVGHYAALVRKAGDLYLLKDPTFRNDTWATRQALEDETSGYFLVPPGPLAKGWRAVGPREGNSIWGKGFVTVLDPGSQTRRDLHTGPQVCRGMMVPSVHLMTVNLSLVDQPAGYTPPVGPAVPFTVRYNSLDGFQPANAPFSNLGQAWSCDWITYLADSPSNSLADVTWHTDGGYRTFTGFNTNTQSFAFQQYDETLLTRTATNPISYTMTWPDGSQMVFNQSDGSVGTTRNIFLSQMIDPQGNAVTLTYDTNLLLVAITDAIGQVTTLTYGLSDDPYKITKVTDPFGRFATFDYAKLPYERLDSGCPDNCHSDFFYDWHLTNITDVIGLSSQITNDSIYSLYFASNNVQAYFIGHSVKLLITPYGSSSFALSYGNGVNRSAEITYPDGSRERVEFNPGAPGIGDADPPSTVPQGMPTIFDHYLNYRNTFYWSRNACATSYGDYSRARIFHWLHASVGVCSGILESSKEPLENRVWYGYAGQSPNVAGPNNLPTQIGRALDDGSTQLFTYGYNGFGRITNTIDPAGRTFSYLYATNGVDLLEVRMTRASKNELLFSATYNSRHRPLTTTDAAGQTASYSYNARGQVLSVTNARNETLSFDYDSNGYLLAIHGPLGGTNDTSTVTYDAFGRPQTITDASGYTRTFGYDNLNRLTQTTYPDATFEQLSYDRLDPAVFRDRAGRLTFFNHDRLRQLTQITDPLGRTTHFEWCGCGALKGLTDPMGRTTSWLMDVQGRPIAKQFADGSQITYAYENTTSRLRQVMDEKQQRTYFFYNPDNTFRFIGYANATVPTPGVSYAYDPDYKRVTSVTDGAGTALYSYIPVAGNPALGAGRLATVTGPLTNETVAYGYDELGRRVHRAINEVGSARTYDASRRVMGATNALGSFGYAYDGSSGRLLSQSFPNGQTRALSYAGNLQDFALQQISYAVGAAPVSQFGYGRDIPRGRITTWSQQAGTQPPSTFSFAYDDADQLVSGAITNGGTLVDTFAYAYDLAGNRLTERSGGSNYAATYNTLNQLSTTTSPHSARTNEWDVANRLRAVDEGNQRTEFTYDGQSRMVGIRKLVNGVEVSHRLFVWDGPRISEERDTNGLTTKRFFAQGVQVVTGTNAGSYYYTRDHLGSIRELTDASGNVRAHYAYDPFGRRTKLTGDVDADVGFAGMFWSAEANLSLTHFRAYDPSLGRWLSRDPLNGAETSEGPNLYAYVRNEPVKRTDPQGLCYDTVCAACRSNPQACVTAGVFAEQVAEHAVELEEALPAIEVEAQQAPACVQTAAGYAAGPISQPAIEYADTLPPLPPELADTAAAAAQSLAPQNRIVWDWVDESGQEILGDEAEILTENLEWAERYYHAAMDNLAQLGLTGYQAVVQHGQILRTMAMVRGSSLP